MFGKSSLLPKRGRVLGATVALAGLFALTACETLTPRQQITGTNNDAEKTGRFGSSVAISGNGLVMAVGVPLATHEGNTFAGLVRVYERENAKTDWSLLGVLAAQDPAKNQVFGTSVAINNTGSIIAVGAPGNSSYAAAGNAYIFSRVAPGDEHVLSSSLIASAPGVFVDTNQNFGNSVTLSKEGFRLAVGAPRGDAKTTDTGRVAVSDAGVVEVFDWASGQVGEAMGWKRQARVSDTNPQASAFFGRSVAMSDDGQKLIVGSPYHDTVRSNDGRALYYGYENGALGNSFYFRQVISDGETNDAIRDTNSNFGWSVAISADGSTMALGATGFANNVGAAMVQTFDKTTNLFKFTRTYSKGTSSAGTPGSIGYSVDLSGDGSRLIIGAPTSNGSVGAWGLVNTKTHELEFGNAGGAGEQVGIAVAISDAGQVFPVSAPLGNTGRGLLKINDTFKVPTAPVINTATPGDKFVALTWRASTNVTADLLTTYRVYAGDVGPLLLCTTIGTACFATGLTNGTEYSFTVTATNAIGTSVLSAAVKARPLAAIVNPQLPTDFANQVAPEAAPTTAPEAVPGAVPGATPDPGAQTGGGAAAPLTGVGSVPGAPTVVKVVAGRRNVKISWSAPTSDGGQAVIGYTVTATPGGRTCTTSEATATSCTITKLGDLKKYTFAVVATNIVGSGAASEASRSVWTQPKVSRTKAATAKSIAQFAGLKVPASAKFSVRVIGKKSPSYCSLKAGTIIGKASGPCRVRVSVTNKGVTTSKNVTLRTVR